MFLQTKNSFEKNMLLNNSGVVSLDSDNFDATLREHQLVFVLFFVEWCRYSQQIKPIFEKSSKHFGHLNHIVFASVECDDEGSICEQFDDIKGYPTLKLFRYGNPLKHIYRGARNVEAINKYIMHENKLLIQIFVSKEDLENRIDNTKNNVIGYFNQTNGEQYANFLNVSLELHKYCVFWMGTGIEGNTTIFARVSKKDLIYPGSIENIEALKEWIYDKFAYIPGRPRLILYRMPWDEMADNLFLDAVKEEFLEYKKPMTLVFKNGKNNFPHSHSYKTQDDLPFIAFESDRLYFFDGFEKYDFKGQIRQFLKELHSGKFYHTKKQNFTESTVKAATKDFQTKNGFPNYSYLSTHFWLCPILGLVVYYY